MKQEKDAQKPRGLEGVVFARAEDVTNAQYWADGLQLPCLSMENLPKKPDEWALWLKVSDDFVALMPVGRGAPGSVSLNFDEPARLKRFKNGVHERNQPLAKAVGLQKGTETILDATAGLGVDTQMLLSWGLHVTALERHPVLGKLWAHALAQCQSPHIREAFKRLEFMNENAQDFLESTTRIWDVIYLDPMYPERKKGAAGVKKEMQIFRKLVGEDLDASSVLVVALEKVNKRVVVKRPKNAPLLNAMKPDVQIKGTVVRFDIYLR